MTFLRAANASSRARQGHLLAGAGGAPLTPIAAASRIAASALFQRADAASRPSTIGGSAYNADVWGPTNKWVDNANGWRWANAGGDWIDQAGTPQGTASPFISVAINVGSGTAYTTSATAAVQYAQTNNRWLALMFGLSAGSGARSIATPWHSTLAPPSIAVTYTDATTATLACRLVGATSGSIGPVTTAGTISLPAFVEFDRPTKPVASATLTFTVDQQFSGAATMTGYMLNPPLNAEPATTGVAANAGALDVNILAQPGVFGAQRVLDGTSLADFVAVASTGMNTASESNFSPEFWGGAVDNTKWPHTVTGKWINPPAGLSLVASSYTGEGFEPLAPGVAAFRVHMPSANIPTGGEGGSFGTTAITSFMFLPPAQMGMARTVFVRYYARLGTPYLRTPADRTEVLNSGAPTRVNMTGKWGITPAHQNSYGGNSGGSGGPFGHQARNLFVDCDASLGGPDEGGIIPGTHIFDDFKSNNPAGYRYGSAGDAGQWDAQRERWGAMGGLGGMLYAGRWYCIEHEVTLNTATAGSFTPDGAWRTWVDGRLVMQETGAVMRTLPAHAPAYDPTKLRPMRELGHTQLWWNWFHGGDTQNSVARTMFYTAPVWGTQRIGPMNLAAPPALTAGSVTPIGYAAGTHPQGLPAVLEQISPKYQSWNPLPGTEGPWGRVGINPIVFGFDKAFSFCGVCYDPVNRKVYGYGSGHLTSCVPVPWAYDLATDAYSWLAVPPPSDGFAVLNGNPATPANVAAAYPASQVDSGNGEWQGGWSGWPAGFARPGKVFPEAGHNYGNMVYVPPSIAGNTKGHFLPCTEPAGSSISPGNRIQHYFDLDTNEWARTVNKAPQAGANAGSVCLLASIGKVLAITGSGSAYRSVVNVYDPPTKTWSTRAVVVGAGPDGVPIASEHGGLRDHPPSGLLINFAPVSAANVFDVATPVAHRLTATAAANFASGTGTGTVVWQDLAVTATSWPLLPTGAGGGYGNTIFTIQWAYCPRNGKFYAVDGRHNSTTLWVLSPPAGAATQAQYMAGTWTVSTETLLSPISSRNSGGNPGVAGVYNKLFWDEAIGALLYMDEFYQSRIQRIVPLGV